jgi:hypothetical protein
MGDGGHFCLAFRGDHRVRLPPSVSFTRQANWRGSDQYRSLVQTIQASDSMRTYSAS